MTATTASITSLKLASFNNPACLISCVPEWVAYKVVVADRSSTVEETVM
jgi:hypothetical protein